MPQTQKPKRRSARIILLDEKNRVLLVRFRVPRAGGDFVFWATPGGGIEPGETPVAAATRELREEMGLTLLLTGPVLETTSRFEHEGVMVDSIDVFFVGRCRADEPVLGGQSEAELRAMRELKWWSDREIEASEEMIFPEELASTMRLFAMPAR